MTGRRVGLFGGTFDPPHLGHLVAAHQVREQLGLDSVWLVVANDPWQKEGTRRITSAATRLAWTAAAVEGVDGLEVSDIELDLGGPSYTYETVAALAEQHPGTEWFVVVGADAAAGLDTWHRADELRELVELVIVNRPGQHPSPPAGWRVRRVEIPALDVSSTALRSMVAAGRSIRFLVPDRVMEMVAASGAYRREP